MLRIGIKIMPHTHEHYLGIQDWQVKAIEKSIKKANSKNAKFVTHQEVSDWLNSWGDDREQDLPK